MLKAFSSQNSKRKLSIFSSWFYQAYKMVLYTLYQGVHIGIVEYESISNAEENTTHNNPNGDWIPEWKDEKMKKKTTTTEFNQIFIALNDKTNFEMKHETDFPRLVVGNQAKLNAAKFPI